MKSKLLYYDESADNIGERSRQAKRFAYLLEHHMDVLLQLFPTPDTSDVGVQYAIDQAILKQERGPTRQAGYDYAVKRLAMGMTVDELWVQADSMDRTDFDRGIEDRLRENDYRR